MYHGASIKSAWHSSSSSSSLSPSSYLTPNRSLVLLLYSHAVAFSTEPLNDSPSNDFFIFRPTNSCVVSVSTGSSVISSTAIHCLSVPQFDASNLTVKCAFPFLFLMSIQYGSTYPVSRLMCRIWKLTPGRWRVRKSERIVDGWIRFAFLEAMRNKYVTDQHEYRALTYLAP